MAEPPCRQRRLEPWRQNVREQCHTDAKTHCIQEEPPHNNRAPTLASSMRSFDDEVDSFISSSSDHVYHQQLDMDSIFNNNMLGFSLRAFDQMMSEVVSPSYVTDSLPVVEQKVGEAEKDEGKKDDVGEENWDDPRSPPLRHPSFR